MGLSLKGLINPENGYYVYKVTTPVGQQSFLQALLAQSGVKGIFGQYEYNYYLAIKSEHILKEKIESKMHHFVSPMSAEIPKGNLALIDDQYRKKEILVGLGVLKQDKDRIIVNPQMVHQF